MFLLSFQKRGLVFPECSMKGRTQPSSWQDFGGQAESEQREMAPGLVKRRHTHVGAPDNRIKALQKEHVLTPRGRDMIPELGPVVTVSPDSKLSYLYVWSNGNFKLVGLRSGFEGCSKVQISLRYRYF